MKPGTPCLHCTKSGCAIYERRPVNPCRNFICSWMEDDSPLPKQFKPNECGVIIMLNHQWKGRKVILAVPAGEKIQPAMLKFLTTHAQRTSTPLIWTENLVENGKIRKQKGRGFGPPAFIKAVKEHLKTDDFIRI